MNTEKRLGLISSVIEREKTPFYIYDESSICEQIELLKCFDLIRYAQKACSNLAILSIMRREGVVIDAVSAGEIHRALKVGYSPGDIVYTADIFDADSLELIKEHKIPVNIGSIDMLDQLSDAFPEAEVTLRFNPGFGHGHSRKTNTGGDLSKHGIWYEDASACRKKCDLLGFKVTGLHMHIGSGSDFQHLAKVCQSMLDISGFFVDDLKSISAGGGLPVDYEGGGQAPIDILAYYQLWNEARNQIAYKAGRSIALEVEPGRFLTAQSALLISEIRAVKWQGKNKFYLLDAGFNDLIRPSMYGAVHTIEFFDKKTKLILKENLSDAIIGGPLCESGDIFTQRFGGYVESRKFPDAKVGDFVFIKDAGAYGASMSSNYNSKVTCAEYLINDGWHLIRKRQSIEELFVRELVPDYLNI